NTLYANEGTLTWTAPSDGIDKGSIITVSNESGWTATSGSITSSGSIAFAGGGDQIIVYQGTSSSPTLIYAFSTSSWITSGTINSNTSYLPSGLSNGTTAHCFSSTNDNGFYANETIIDSQASALSSISNDENWTKSNDPVTFPTWTYQGEQPPLPVVLTSFTATISNQNYINLTWITQTENGMMGYYVMRSTQNDLSSARVVSPLIPAANTSQPKAYLYTDTEVTESGTYYYWLQCNDYDGIINTYGSISIEYNPGGGNTTPSIPLVTELLPVFPNPFNPQLFIPFNLANKLEVKIIIYNTRGQIVKEIPVGEQNPGNYRIEWDGKDSKGQALPTGIYCIRMIAGKDYYQTKAILMK
ncbi:MAG: T9SS type A sorting domain-containing protein, partial [Candidatus Syntrophosphaera sp.]|nr:T9SS type A sorting domain-containing protein [Candidatus Syntrophosphaera sp.]